MIEKNHRISRDFSSYPILWLTIAFSVGIFLTQNFYFPRSPLLTAMAVAAIAAYFTSEFRQSGILLLASFLFAGGFCLQVENSSFNPNRIRVLFDSGELQSGKLLQIEGVADGMAETSPGVSFLSMALEKIVDDDKSRDVSGNVKLSLAVKDAEVSQVYQQMNIQPGSRMTVLCELQREERFQNPGGISSIKILDQQGFDATCKVKEPNLIHLNPASSKALPLTPLYQFRQRFLEEIEGNLSAKAAGVLIASLLGNKHFLDKPTSESFRDGGIYHIVVISGLQITVIGGITIWLLGRLTKNRWRQFLLANVFLWCYTLAVGAESPVTRAAIMFTIWSFGYVVFRTSNLLNSLSASALILLVYRPSDLFDQSFQLTYLCVFSIAGISLPLMQKLKSIGQWMPDLATPTPPRISGWLKTLCETLYWSENNWNHEQAQSVWKCHILKSPYAAKLETWRLQNVLRMIFEIALTSASVQATLLPLSILYFHRISFISIVLNIWAGALIGLESVTVIIGILVKNFSHVLAAPFFWATEIVNSILLNSTIYFVDNNWASIRIPFYSGAGKVIYLLWFTILGVSAVVLFRWSPFSLKRDFANERMLLKICFPVGVLLLLLMIFHPFSAVKPDGRLHLDFIDVGQGDSTLITMPTGETILVDGGGHPTFDQTYVQQNGESPERFEPDEQRIGEVVVSNFLWNRGYDSLDYVLATHADADHIQGLTDVVNNFAVKTAFVARTPSKDVDYQELQSATIKRKTPVSLIGRGDVLEFGNVRVEVLSPEEVSNTDAIWGNNQCVVLRIIYGSTKFLLTADIEKEAESTLLHDEIKADVVKIAHHGSKTSSTQAFIDAVNAKTAIISVGKHSPYGHPNQAVVERWKNSGASIFTTGENGLISIASDGKSIAIQTFVK